MAECIGPLHQEDISGCSIMVVFALGVGKNRVRFPAARQ